MRVFGHFISINYRKLGKTILIADLIFLLLLGLYWLTVSIKPDFDFSINLSTAITSIIALTAAIYTYQTHRIQKINSQPILIIGEIFFVTVSKTKSKIYITMTNQGVRPATIVKEILVCLNPKYKDAFCNDYSQIELTKEQPTMIDLTKSTTYLRHKDTIYFVKVFYIDIDPSKILTKSFYFRLITINEKIHKQTISKSEITKLNNTIYAKIFNGKKFMEDPEYFIS